MLLKSLCFKSLPAFHLFSIQKDQGEIWGDEMTFPRTRHRSVTRTGSRKTVQNFPAARSVVRHPQPIILS